MEDLSDHLEIIEAHIHLAPLLSAMPTFQNPINYGWIQPSPRPTFFTLIMLHSDEHRNMEEKIFHCFCFETLTYQYSPFIGR